MAILLAQFLSISNNISIHKAKPVKNINITGNLSSNGKVYLHCSVCDKADNKGKNFKNEDMKNII